MFDIKNLFKQNNELNGLEVFIMQSQENKDICFQVMQTNDGLNGTLNDFLYSLGFEKSDFTDYDYKKIQDKFNKLTSN